MLRDARVVFYAVATVFLILLGVLAFRLETHVEDALASVSAIETNTTRLEAEASGLLNASRQVILAERSASAEQIKQIDLISKQTSALIEHADAAVTDFDLAAKQSLVGAATDEADLSALLRQSTISLRQVGDNANLLLENATTAIDASQTKEAMANVVTATQSLAAATEDAQATMASVRKGVEYEVSELMKPVRKVKVVGEEAVRLLGRFLGY
jgi:hypothetical protein